MTLDLTQEEIDFIVFYCEKSIEISLVLYEEPAVRPAARIARALMTKIQGALDQGEGDH